MIFLDNCKKNNSLKLGYYLKKHIKVRISRCLLSLVFQVIVVIFLFILSISSFMISPNAFSFTSTDASAATDLSAKALNTFYFSSNKSLIFFIDSIFT